MSCCIRFRAAVAVEARTGKPQATRLEFALNYANCGRIFHMIHPGIFLSSEVEEYALIGAFLHLGSVGTGSWAVGD